MASSSASVASRSRSSIGVVTKWPRVSSSASRSRPADSRSDGAVGHRRAEDREQASAGRPARARRRTPRRHAPPAARRRSQACSGGRAPQLRPRPAGSRSKSVDGGLALALRPALPVERRRRHHFAHPRRGTRDGLETLPGVTRRRSASGAKSRVIRLEHAEDRFAGPQRRIALHEVAAVVLGERDLEMRGGEVEVDAARERRDRSLAACPERASAVSRAQRPHLVGLGGRARRATSPAAARRARAGR